MKSQTSRKILIADDEEETLYHISNILKRAEHEVISTTKGSEVVNLVRDFKPDLIILDIFMPDMDGGEVAANLSEEESTKDIPIIYLTALISKNEESKIKKSGKHYLVAKPTTSEELLATVNKAILEHFTIQ
jgi:CheY-like chemotaxis protein